MRHLLFQSGDTLFGDLAVFDERSISREVFREEFASWNLDSKVLFETENDVQKIDGLSAEVVDQRRFFRYLVVVDPQRVDQCFLNFLKDFVA